jgi:alpha-beta hydrolase superfamily lysophospholipase
MRIWLRRSLFGIICGFGGTLVTLVIASLVFLGNLPDLSVWHTARLDEEFTAESKVDSFEEYIELEDRLFDQLNERVYDRVEVGDERDINRYHRGSLTDPDAQSTNWNRSFEFPNWDAHAGVLLIHGLSDSPYSLRSIGESLSADGAWVLGLRVPGHGTAPSGLVYAKWEDMEAAVRLAMSHLRARMDDRPIHIVGYSNGAALALLYALETLRDESLAKADGLVLISPEIGISKLAALAVWQSRFGKLLRLPKLSWKSVSMEYDPFKYGSFAVNAGDQAYRLTMEIQRRITLEGNRDTLSRLSPILAFQSVVDATVSAPALIEGLFYRLPRGDHELVLFDVNQHAVIGPLLQDRTRDTLELLLVERELEFTVTLVTNASETSNAMVARLYPATRDEITEVPIEHIWPPQVYSLSHVALPIRPDDPLYGFAENPDYDGIRLGNIALRGERGVLRVEPSAFLRLRSNPFYDYLLKRTRDFVNVAESDLDQKSPVGPEI